MRSFARSTLFMLALVLVTVVFAPDGTSAAGAHAWTRVGLGAVTQPAPVGNRFVMYSQHARQLRVVALNAVDGSTAWTAAASPSDVTAGQPAVLAIRGETVFYLGKATAFVGAAQLVARNVGTGRVIWQSAIGDFESWPEICPDESDAICVTGVLPGLQPGELHFDATTGRPLASLMVGTTSDPGRELGFDLFDPGTRSPELLVATKGNSIEWRRPLSSIFNMAHASSDGGWNFDLLSDRGLFVGSVGTTPVVKNGTGTENLAGPMTAGFKRSNGQVVWRAPGWFACYELPCPGLSEAGYTSPGDQPDPTVALRTVATGTATFSMGPNPRPHVSANASVTIQGFNPDTGRTIWSYDAGRNLGLISDSLLPPDVGQDSIVLRSGGTFVALDLRTGSHHAISATTPAWCESTIVYHLANSSYYGGKSGEYVGQSGLFACSASGHRRADSAPLPALVGRMGATADGVTAWTDTTAVHAEPSGR